MLSTLQPLPLHLGFPILPQAHIASTLALPRLPTGVSTVGQCLRVPQTPVNASEHGQQRSLEQPAQAVLLPLLRQGHLWAPLHCSWHLEHTPAGLLNPSLPGPVPGGQLRSVHGRRTLLCAVVANSVLTRADAPRSKRPRWAQKSYSPMAKEALVQERAAVSVLGTGPCRWAVLDAPA